MEPLEQITAIAKEAFIYGYPIVDNQHVIHQYVLDKQSKEYKAPFNQVGHNRSVATPKDTAIVSMNVDTPYSFAWLDLRAESVVLTIPPFEQGRYVSVQLIDLYTYIVGYISPRTYGNTGGNFSATPFWSRYYRSPWQIGSIITGAKRKWRQRSCARAKRLSPNIWMLYRWAWPSMGKIRNRS